MVTHVVTDSFSPCDSMEVYHNIAPPPGTDITNVTFAGRNWYVSGYDNFAADNRVVWVDLQGRLHLKIDQIGGVWKNVEVFLDNLGMGKYSYTVETNLTNIQKDVVLGMFLYKDNDHEIDIERSNWGDLGNTDEMSYTVQPGPPPADRQKKWNLSDTGHTHHVIDWKPDGIDFYTYAGDDESGTLLNSHHYTGEILDSGLKPIINMWLYPYLTPPDPGVSVEIVISSFGFTAYEGGGQGEPRVVGDTSLVGPMCSSMGSHLYYAAGRYWCFYCDGTVTERYGWRTSLDGITWGAFTPIVYSLAGCDMQVAFDGTRFHYARCPSTNLIVYRSGTPQADGTIVWDGVEDTCVDNANSIFRVTSIAIDSAGKCLVGYRESSNLQHCYVTKNNDANTTWSTATGYPKQISESNSVSYFIGVVPLTGGKWYAVYSGTSNNHLLGKLWDGANLSAVEQCTDVVCSAYYRWAVCGKPGSDDVYLSWNADTSNYKQRVRKRISGTWTGAYQLAQTNSYLDVPLTCVNRTTGDIYSFWHQSQHIWYRKYTFATSTWGNAVDFITEAVAFSAPDTMQISPYVMNGKILLAYTVPNYEIHFAFLSAEEDTTSTKNLTDNLSISEYVSVTKQGQTSGPWEVGTSSTSLAFGHTMSPKAFYANGRYWVFYSNGSYGGYVSSVNGSSWTTFVSLFTAANGTHFHVAFDGEYLHYVRGYDTGNLLYRRGVPNPNGSISWTPEVSCGQGGSSCRATGLCTDSFRRPVMVYYRDQELWCDVNASTNGQWSHLTGFPQKVSSLFSVYNEGVPVPLRDGYFYVAWTGEVGGSVKGRLWNGVSFGAEEQITSLVASAVHRWAILSNNDDIHFTWNAQDNLFNIYYRFRGIYGWTTAVELLHNCAYSQTPGIHYNAYWDSVFVIWGGSNHIYYRKNIYGEWAAYIDYYTETGTVINEFINVSRRPWSDFCIIGYTRGSGNPYSVRVMLLPSIGMITSSISRLRLITGVSNNSGYFSI